MLNTPTATRTGIVIGGAWQPKRSPSYAEAIEAHQRHLRLIDRLCWAGAVVGIAALVALCYCVSGA